MLISVETLLELFTYDPITGYITRIKSYGRACAGQVFIDATHISVLGISVRSNRLAWALYYKEWPPEDMWVDHENTIKADRSIKNLRLATPTQNAQNKSGYGIYSKGVTWRDRKEKPFQAKIRVNGIRIHLGSFALEEEAAEAYREAAIKYHGGFARYD